MAIKRFLTPGMWVLSKKNTFSSFSSNIGFLQPDPTGFASGSADFYGYEGNSPVDAIDPSGLLELPGLDPFAGIRQRIEAAEDRLRAGIRETGRQAIGAAALVVAGGFIRAANAAKDAKEWALSPPSDKTKNISQLGSM